MSQAASEVTQYIPFEELVRSPTQPRKAFPKEALEDLARSIEAQGVLQPLIVRSVQKGHLFEVVDGERRWRAAELTPLKTVPCLIRELTDQEVVQIQVIQAIHRAELTPLEEAQAYKRLQDEGMGLDDLVAKVGKDKRYIFHRAALLDLHPDVQAAVVDGTLKLAFAEAFAKVPDQDRQLKLLPLALQQTSLAGLNTLIEERFLLQLAHAPFDTKNADLVPEAGPCAACPKRTGAQSELFGDPGKADSCQDQACWITKCNAQEATLIEASKAKGVEVLAGRQAVKVLKGVQRYDNGPGKHAYADSRPFWLKEGTLGAAAKAASVKPLHVFDANSGKIRQVFDLEAVKAAVPAKLKAKETPQAKAQSPEDQAAAQRKQMLARMVDRALDEAALKALWEAMKKKPASAAVLQAAFGLLSTDEEFLAGVMGQTKRFDIKKAAPTPQAGVAVLLVSLLGACYGGPEREEQAAVYKAAGIDLKALKKKVQEEITAKVEAEEKEKAAAADKSLQVQAVANGEDSEDQEAEDGEEAAPAPKKSKAKAAKKAGKKKGKK